MTTIGQLVTELFTTYERQLHDPRLAAIETKLVVEELLRRRERITPARVIEKAA